MKIIYFGTPEISVKFLEELINSEQVLAVITQPDRPSGRGRKLHISPVKSLAEKHNIPIFQPEKFEQDLIEQIRELKPEAGVVVSYGKLIPEKVFTLPFYGCFNVHFSLLPKYRGAAPIQWALINGEKQTGVSTFWIEKTLDSGPILVQKDTKIDSEDDVITLTDKLIKLGIDTMKETLNNIKAGKCVGKKQSEPASFAPSLKKEHGKIDWFSTAEKINNLIRGTKPWPSAYTKVKTGNLEGKMIKVLKARVLKNYTGKEICFPDMPISGQIMGLEKNVGFVVLCGEDFLLIEEVHPENKKPMPAWAFWQGGHLKLGDRFA